MTSLRHTIALAGFFALAAGAPGALATSGPGCYQVVNVESWDVLNLRSRASAKSAIVDMLRPGNHGIIAGEGACTPTSRPLLPRHPLRRRPHRDRLGQAALSRPQRLPVTGQRARPFCSSSSR